MGANRAWIRWLPIGVLLLILWLAAFAVPILGDLRTLGARLLIILIVAVAAAALVGAIIWSDRTEGESLGGNERADL